MASRIDKEKLGAYIKDIVTKIHTEADVELLNAYRSQFRKSTSFFNRSYVAAYLLMQSEAGKSFCLRNKNSRPKGRRAKDEQRTEAARSIPEEEAVYLFISIGRNRRVYPREILSLINAKTRTAKDDVGIIRVLDNYSFVQVRETAATEIIGALNGKPFRGRTLTVNYARNRNEDEGGENAETEET